ncbi:hypothetical protein EDC01DRAFT_664850 [Geopyxis carbonaria]|nr:hypothetical protein EDC01DRAFT_664850 [Geopyxis carbonaria]
MLSPTIYSGTFIHTPSTTSLTILKDTSIFVDGDGKIAHIAPSSLKFPDGWEFAPIVQATAHQFFFPGFIDTHIHASQYPNAGIFGNSTLLDWLETYTFPMESALSSCPKAHTVYSRIIARTLSHGTTTASYFATIHVDSTNVLADLCLAAGQRAFIGRVCMDQNSPSTYCDESSHVAVKRTEAVIAHCRKIDPNSDLITAIVTPRFAPTCSAPLLKLLGDLVHRENLPVQTHISENKAETAWVSKLFPDSTSYANVYETAGLLTNRTVLAHGVHLTADEIAIIKRCGSGVSHCPLSNLALTSGNAHIKHLLKEGVKVGLGTDVSGGYSVSLLESIRQATLVSHAVASETGSEADKISVSEALYLGTRGGAEVLGIQDKVGIFEVGMEWDAVLVGFGDVPSGNEYGRMEENESASLNIQENPVDLFGWETWEEKVAKWVYNGDDRNSQAVWVRGRKVYSR